MSLAIAGQQQQNDSDSISSGNSSPLNASAAEHCPSLDDCLYFVVDIDRAVPLEYALPLYGFLMPVFVLITTAINSFIMVVLSRRHLRTPTNFVLLAMALADLLTGLSSIPWFLFYYTLRGFELDKNGQGLPSFWCRVYPLFSQIVPTVWHTFAIWLSVFLAVQRFVYVCVPSQVHRFCTPRRTRRAVGATLVCSVLVELPELFGKYMERVPVGPNRAMCLLRYSAWVRMLGIDLFFSIHYWFRALVHALPCLLLLVFTLALTRTIREAQLRRRSWTPAATGGPQPQQTQEQPSSASEEPNREQKRPSWGQQNGVGRSLDATNRMLAAICSVFLFIELPAVLIFTLHLLITTGLVTKTSNAYWVLNVCLIIRNLLIVLTSPLQFCIYCSMSEQFRLTVRQLFSASPLFIAQAQANTYGGKRYSLILVDVELIRRSQSQKFAPSSAKASAAVRPLHLRQQQQNFWAASGNGGNNSLLNSRRRYLSLQPVAHRSRKETASAGEEDHQQQLRTSTTTGGSISGELQGQQEELVGGGEKGAQTQQKHQQHRKCSAPPPFWNSPSPPTVR